MMQQFTIPGKLPSLNDLIHAMNHNRYSGAKLKRTTQYTIAAYAMSIRAMSKPVTVHVTWYERDRRRDVDNVQSGIKYILDALVAIGKLPDDSQKYVTAVSHDVRVDKANPRIVVTLEEAS